MAKGLVEVRLDGRSALCFLDLEQSLSPRNPIGKRPNGTHWKDQSDHWCYALFGRRVRGGPYVRVGQGDGDWNVDWWFAGIRDLDPSHTSAGTVHLVTVDRNKTQEAMIEAGRYDWVAPNNL